MANTKIQGYAQRGGNTVTTQGLISTTKVEQSFPSATITVFDTGTLNLSTIYSDSAGTPKSNPFSAATDGLWFFYVPMGNSYDVRFSGVGFASFTLSDLIAPGGGGQSGAAILNSPNLFTAVNTFKGVPSPDAAQGNTASVNLLRGADSTFLSPLNSDIASTFFQTFRTGGTNGVARFGFNYNYNVNGISAADNYPHFIMARLAQDMTGTPNASYFHEVDRTYLYASITNITSQTIHVYAKTIQAERTTSGYRIIGLYSEIRNSTSSDANVLNSSIDTTYPIVTSQGGISHNTGLWFAEGPDKATSNYFGIYFAANSIAQRAFDLSATTQTLQGTWTATNASPTLNGSGGHANVEAIQGDYLLINGTYARVLGAIANTITLTANFSGSSGSSLTLTKSTQAMWLRENQPILSLNHAGTSKKELVRLTEVDKWKFDQDALTCLFGGFVNAADNFVNHAMLGAITNSGIDYAGLWFGSTTPSLANYSFLYEPTLQNTILNAPQAIDLRVGNLGAWYIDANRNFFPQTNNAFDLGDTTHLIGNINLGKGIYFTEQSDPSAPSTNIGVLYVRDNGGGKSQLVVRFPTGAVQVVATEP